MARLSVNIDHIATIRQARMGKEPDPVAAAFVVEMAGADGITIHLREDRRHIQDRDLRMLRDTIRTRLNLEMAATSEMLNIAIKTGPDLVTLVPEKRAELTTEGGLDILASEDELTRYVSLLKKGGIPVSLFVDPNGDQIKAAKKTGADYVEIHTGTYADAVKPSQRSNELKKIMAAIETAAGLGLGINAGHGLNYSNIKALAGNPKIEEFSIGHSIISRAVIVGLEKAVRDMAELVKG